MKTLSKGIFRLGARIFALSFLLFFAIYNASFYAGLFFIFFSIYWYVKPAINLGKFGPELTALPIILILLPKNLGLEELFLLSLIFAGIIILAISLKNLEILNRERGNFFLDIAILSLFNYIFFYNNLGIFSSILTFAFTYWLLSDYYKNFIDKDKANLAAIFTGFVLGQLNLFLLYSASTVAAKLVFSILALYLLTDILAANFKQIFSPRIAYQTLSYVGLGLIISMIFINRLS